MRLSILVAKNQPLLFGLAQKEAKSPSPTRPLLASCCKAQQSSAELVFSTSHRLVSNTQTVLDLLDCWFYKHLGHEAREDAVRTHIYSLLCWRREAASEVLLLLVSKENKVFSKQLTDKQGSLA
jgi:hypothetical protein